MVIKWGSGGVGDMMVWRRWRLQRDGGCVRGDLSGEVMVLMNSIMSWLKYFPMKCHYARVHGKSFSIE